MCSVAMVCLLMTFMASCEKSHDDNSGGDQSSATNTPVSDNPPDTGTGGQPAPTSTSTPPPAPQASVVPESGNYSFSANGSFSVSGSTLTYSVDGYSLYPMTITPSGWFSYQNGYVYGSDHGSDSGKEYPTDGFVIWGHFDSSTSASGTIEYVYNGQITSTASFTASR